MQKLIALMLHDKHGEYEHRQRQGDRQIEHDFELESSRAHSFPYPLPRFVRDRHWLSLWGIAMTKVV
jgi:hypothetical protein